MINHNLKVNIDKKKENGESSILKLIFLSHYEEYDSLPMGCM
jgi:hypothetical protein